MYVNNVMTYKESLTTVTRDDSAQFALELIQKNNFLSVPIVEKNKFYGAVSKELILEYFYKLTTEKKEIVSISDFKVRDVMANDLPIAHHTDLIENAADLLYVNKAPFVAILDEKDDFKGIITHKAIFKEFTELFGLNKGKRIAVTAYDIPGQILKLTKIVTENRGDVISCVVQDPKSRLAVKEIILRVKTDNYEQLVHKITSAGFKVQ